jgi:beta-glucosidase
MDWWIYLSIFLLIYVLIIIILSTRFPEKYLNWDEIDCSSQTFPNYFTWGVATASHQIEGNNRNNWTAFENQKGLEKSAEACEHWIRWKDDFDLIEQLGVDSYRLSIEWSRIQPNQGEWNQDALDQYEEMIDNLISRNIKPMITLHHFSHPIWFEEMGGFCNRENVDLWIDYCKRIFESLNGKVNDWCTVNEPEVFSIMGYHMKMFPPGKSSVFKTIRVMKNMIYAHSSAYWALKKINPDARIGLAKNVTLFDPLRRWNLLHWITTIVLNYIWNGAIISGLKNGRMFGSKIDSAKGSYDFIGLNYYTHVLTSPFLPQTTEIDLPRRKNEIMTDFGYTMYAEGLERAVKLLSKLNVPIEITENGVADSDDSLRPMHLKRHIWQISKLISEGYDIRSYYHWSLMDNFEWAEGYKLRFGLYHVDYKTQNRTLKQSGADYHKIIQSNKRRANVDS